MNRNTIANELIDGCPDKLMPSHQKIANAIRSGEDPGPGPDWSL